MSSPRPDVLHPARRVRAAGVRHHDRLRDGVGLRAVPGRVVQQRPARAEAPHHVVVARPAGHRDPALTVHPAALERRAGGPVAAVGVVPVLGRAVQAQPEDETLGRALEARLARAADAGTAHVQVHDPVAGGARCADGAEPLANPLTWCSRRRSPCRRAGSRACPCRRTACRRAPGPAPSRSRPWRRCASRPGGRTEVYLTRQRSLPVGADHVDRPALVDRDLLGAVEPGLGPDPPRPLEGPRAAQLDDEEPVVAVLAAADHDVAVAVHGDVGDDLGPCRGRRSWSTCACRPRRSGPRGSPRPRRPRSPGCRRRTRRRTGRPRSPRASTGRRPCRRRRGRGPARPDRPARPRPSRPAARRHASRVRRRKVRQCRLMVPPITSPSQRCCECTPGSARAAVGPATGWRRRPGPVRRRLRRRPRSR